MDVLAHCDACEKPISGDSFTAEDGEATVCANCAVALIGQERDIAQQQLRGAVEEIARLRTWIDVQGRECPSTSTVDLELRDSRSRFPDAGGR